MSKEPAKRGTKQTPEDAFVPNYHGYTDEQVEKIEAARYDDTAPPPVDDGLDEQRKKNEEQLRKDDEQRRKDEEKHAREAEKASKS